jgi:D-alanyl-D-alanine-carboxypeptidase/D-alanyl-D-alanine-endopeptidase
MHKALKVGLTCLVLLVAFLLVSFGALLAYVVHEQHAYKNLPDTHDLAKRTAEVGREYIARRPRGGLVIGVIQNNRRYIGGFGQISATETNPPDGRTLFEIGSITKVFTGVTLAKLAGDGLVKLNDPISDFLPPGVVSPRKNGREITLLQLATHTSGLPRLPANLDTSKKNPYANYTAAELYQSLAEVKLASEPGRKSEYSNYGFGLLGQLLALKAGTNYEALVTRTLCEPLGMSNTVIHLSEDQESRLTPGHNLEGGMASKWDFDALAGCGAFRSDADDLLAFVTANLGTNEAPIYKALADAQKFHFKEFTGGVGLGWQMAEPVEERLIHWHNGATAGYVSFMAFDRQHQAGVVILSNYGDAFGPDAEAVDRMGMEILKLAAKISWQ